MTVAFRSDEVLPGLLHSIGNATTGSPQVYIVNNSLEEPELASRLPADVAATVIEPTENLGYGGGMNLGVASSEASDWVLLANPDLAFGEKAIDRLVEVGESSSEIGIVGPLVYTPTGEIYPSARNLPSLRTGIGHAVFARIWRTNPWTRSYLQDLEVTPHQHDAGWLSGSCLLVRRDVFESVGGFDEKYFMYFEDVDLCARVSQMGYRVVYAPSAIVTHEGGHSTSTVNRAMIRAHHESAYRYLAARYSAWYLAPVRAVLRVGLAVRSRIVAS
ncbi:MAG: glycosyltransferase family 2 protein [Candidatus Saccharibacteria bacterium]|nr:glycosyltransferase family 2 protein [Microbacteriaceae bacterium]